MRILPGGPVTVAQESISSKLLVDQGIIDPDFIPTIFRLFADISPLTALLDVKGYKTKGVNYDTNFLTGGNYRTVSSNHVMYRIAEDDRRKEHFASNPSGVTYVSDSQPTYPGLRGSKFYIFLDSNWIGGNEVIKLADGKTQLYVVDQNGGQEVSGGVFRYEVKINGAVDTDYVDPNLMQEGFECQLVMGQYPQDFSTGGNERYTFAGFGHSYLTLQRFKYSWSGTAAAMDKNKPVTGRWVQHGGGKDNMAFLPMAHERMMKEAAMFLEFQLLEGKTTVDYDTQKVKLTNNLNQEILAGSGVLYSGDGPIEFPINEGWNKKLIESLLADIDSFVRPDEDGARELAVFLHPTSYLNFQSAMSDMGVTADANIVGSGDDKMINNTYSGYTLGGIRLLVNRYAAYGHSPGVPLNDGTKSNEWDGVILPLGLTPSGQRGVELIQLRPMVRGKVAGIDQGGNVSNDIDGSSEHALIQNGIISQIQPIKLYRPYANNM